MPKILMFLSLTIAFFVASGCQQQGKDAGTKVVPNVEVAAESETLKRLSDAYGAAVTAGNVDAFLNLFTDDAILMPPNGQMIIGKDKIRDWVQAGFDSIKGTGFEEITAPNEIRIFDGWAFDVGITTFKSKGKPLEDTNKYIRIWQKQANGSWRLARVIWNSNNPCPPVQEEGK